MKFLKIVKLSILAVLGFNFSVAEPFGSEEKVFNDKNMTLSLSINNEYDTLHPLLTHMVLSHFVINFLFHQLIYLDTTGKYQALIIEEIPTFKNRLLKTVKNKKEYELEAIFILKKNLKWGDGTQISCEDMKFSFEVSQNPHISTPTKEAFSNIYEVSFDEIDKNRCIVKYKKNKWDFFIDTPPPMPAHLERKIYERYKNIDQGYEKNSLYTVDPSNPGLWNGAYVLLESKLGSYLILKRNENFYREKSKIKRIILNIIKDSATLEANLASKNIDMISRFGMSTDQAVGFSEKIAKQKDQKYRVVFSQSNTFQHLGLNLENELLKDVKIRRAISYAINKKDLIGQLLHGRAKPAEDFKLNTFLQKQEKANIRLAYGKKKSREILESIGWKLNSENLNSDFYRYKNGKKLSFELVASSGNKLNEMICAYIQEQLKDVGIEIRIKLETLKYLFSEKLPKGNYDLAFYSFTFLPEYSWFEVFHSNAIPSEKNLWAGYNFSRLRDTAIDSILNKLEKEKRVAKRNQLMKDLINAYKDTLPTIPLYFREENSVIPLNLKNYQLNPFTPFESLWSSEWEIVDN
ncbi:MAG: peptide ABC transporter substrate-binding protein [Bdellovibrionaceae bacterium]|nr:peptide ABC transporter substrate-binding protein [Pseudobdellovibrionaceae bacterium]NUM58365.1 peptide ABC transporter substrate-binding protein [Pseudobdellovibrionaceae bacterium]